MFDSWRQESILARAAKRRIIKITAHNLRDWASGRHKTVDDRPFGGGAGMILKVEPIHKAVTALRKSKIQNPKSKTRTKKRRTRVVLLSAKGKQFTQEVARKYAKLDHIIFICGRYEGVDERVAKHIADEEISIGPYVLTGGELPAMVMIDAISRHIPGVLGNKESLREESFSPSRFRDSDSRFPGTREYPQYTRPAAFSPRKGVSWRVPRVLLSGDHKKIADWRKAQQNTERQKSKIQNNTK